MDKKWITNMNEMCVTKKMLAKLRENRVMQAKQAADQFVTEEKESDNFLTRSKILMEEAVDKSKKKILTEEDEGHKDYFVVKKNTPQFGDIRTSQEETIKKTINDNIKLENDALRYYPDSDDMTLDGKIPALNLRFQFRYNDPSGDGCYVWSEALQLTDANIRVIGKIRNSFMNWRDSITQDAGLMEKLKQAAQKENQ
jgi:hypothetical protein